MKYLCLICAGTLLEATSPEEAEQHFRDYAVFVEDIKDSSYFIGANRLKPPAGAATVRVRDGKVLVTDGPVEETKETLGGYWMINVKSREEVIAWAKRCPAPDNEVIEVRQVQELADFPRDVQAAADALPDIQREPVGKNPL